MGIVTFPPSKESWRKYANRENGISLGQRGNVRAKLKCLTYLGETASVELFADAQQIKKSSWSRSMAKRLSAREPHDLK